jgi:hypothetical protein
VDASGLDALGGHDVDTVAFVRDYVELRVDYSIVRALTEPTGTVDDTEWHFGTPGAADLMRRYIGRVVVAVEVVEGERLSLLLEGDATFKVSLRPEDRVGPEAAHFVPANPDGTLDLGRMVVW